MSLNAALNSAQLSLTASQKRISISARNVAGAGDTDYSRKLTPLVTRDGGVFAGGPIRSSDTRLYERYLESTSVAARENVRLTGLTRLSETVGDTADETSLVGRLGNLTNKLTEYLNAPADDNLGRAAVLAAGDMARAVNDAAAVVDEVKAGAVTDVKASVDRINSLLKDFERSNTLIVQGTVLGADISDDLDRRDAVVAQLSKEIGISVTMRENNDAVLFTDGGVTLFETSARTVSATTVAGQPVRVFIDGVQVAGDAPQMESKNGALVGAVALHNKDAASYGEQLDKFALGLIQAFREIDPANSANTAPGLFVDKANVAVLPTVATGLARSIGVNTIADPSANPAGKPSRLRDGIAYNYNAAENAPAYSQQLARLLDQVGMKNVDLDNKTPLDYAASTVSWVESSRQSSDAAVKVNDAVLTLVTTSLSNARGVDLNEETALQLEIERLFTASAQLISVVDNLFKTLFDAVR